ncbi:3-isopropylmalate dehydratase large subunit [Erysipelotrichaceae bacterium OttesenSCG-928-M19]|nr:3-isopropylmalate dehydratase large subunit [Erysipelotrichaceae bacterium OttesenSCG-928-M19]
MATIFDKIWTKHEIVNDEESLLYIDLHLIHEVTSPQAFTMLEAKKLKVRRPERTYATMDHSIRTDGKKLDDKIAQGQLKALIKNTSKYDIPLARQGAKNHGIVHVIAPEQGLTLPGQTIVCGDSHTATHGAFACIAFGIGTSEIAHVFATQTLWQTKPKNMGIQIIGLNNNISAKDVILYILKEYGVSFGQGYALEFFGKYIDNASMDERMTICNMAIECGAKYGLCAFDQTTYDYLKQVGASLKNIEEYQDLHTDYIGDFDKIIEVNISKIKPVITWGINPSQAVFVNETIPQADSFTHDYMGLTSGTNINEVKITQVFIGSCTNGRLSDFIKAACFLKGNKVHQDVRCLIVPGSQVIKEYLDDNGYTRLFEEAGCEVRNPGCSACLAMNNDTMPANEHVASTSNRNFEGRQGSLSRTHLCSVEMACIAAIHGHFQMEV